MPFWPCCCDIPLRTEIQAKLCREIVGPRQKLWSAAAVSPLLLTGRLVDLRSLLASSNAMLVFSET